MVPLHLPQRECNSLKRSLKLGCCIHIVVSDIEIGL